MRVLLIANVNSSHTKKWCEGLLDARVEVGLFSINPAIGENAWTGRLDYVYFPVRPGSHLVKYIPLYFRLKKAINTFKPQLLHSHYLTNYTLLANLVAKKPHIATAWGSDVYAWPRSGFLNRLFLRWNMRHADVLVSTSKCMRAEMLRYTKKPVEVIPFGVDFSLYSRPADKNPAPVIACFKALEPVYAHDILLKAFAILCKNMASNPPTLLIAGEGSELENLRQLAERLGVAGRVKFAGQISSDLVPGMLSQADLCVYLSRRESFGVSLIEAMAARVPLVLTPTDGFREVAGEELARFVPFDDPAAAAGQMQVMLTDHALRDKITALAYTYARERFDLSVNIRQQVALYTRIAESVSPRDTK